MRLRKKIIQTVFNHSRDHYLLFEQNLSLKSLSLCHYDKIHRTQILLFPEVQIHYINYAYMDKSNGDFSIIDYDSIKVELYKDHSGIFYLRTL